MYFSFLDDYLLSLTNYFFYNKRLRISCNYHIFGFVEGYKLHYNSLNRDFRLPPRSRWNLRFSGILCLI